MVGPFYIENRAALVSWSKKRNPARSGVEYEAIRLGYHLSTSSEAVSFCCAAATGAGLTSTGSTALTASTTGLPFSSSGSKPSSPSFSWHQLSLHMIHGLGKGFDEFIEVFFVQENLMPVVPIIIEPLATLRNGQVVIIPTGCAHVKKISPSLTGTDALAVHAVHSLVVVVVPHSSCFG
jgi:hypothetical protein